MKTVSQYGLWCVLLVSLVACSVQPVPPQPQSPLQKPLASQSPLARQSPVQPPAAPPIVNRTNKPLVDLKAELEPAVLTPPDVRDLFGSASFAIRQPADSADMQGLLVMYPTRSMDHTTAFAEGFATQIQVYKDVMKAALAYETFAAKQSGKVIEMGELGDASRAWEGKVLTPEGQQLDIPEYVAQVRQQNALVVVTIRTSQKVAPGRLGDLANLVLSRLSP